MSIETVAFGLPALIGLIVSLTVLYQFWKRKKILIKNNTNGTKILIVERDLNIVRWLTAVEGVFTFAALTVVAREIWTTIPQPLGRAIVPWSLVLGSILVMVAIISLKRSQTKIERTIEDEIRKGK